MTPVAGLRRLPFLLRTFSELSGQDDALQRIRATLIGGRVHHALLFCGPDGVGKHLAASHLAQVFVCRNQADPSVACGDCPSCFKCQNTAHPDILIIEPNEKGRITVDNIRDAAQALHIQALEGAFKVLIIRDADRMNHQAQNALLKTLEEPPGQTKIILSSAKPQQLLLTVLSRCQRIDFRRVASATIAKMLIDKTDVDESTAHLVAALSQGSPAQALSTDPEETLSHRDHVADFDMRLSRDDRRAAATAIELSSQLCSDKEQLESRLQLLGVWLRDQILLASNTPDPEIANIDRQSDLQNLAEQRGLMQLLARARALQTAQEKLIQPFNLNTALIIEQLCLSFAGQNGSHS